MVGAPATPLAAINPASLSTPSRSTGNDTGSPISPRSPLVNQTRLLTLPGSTATTRAVAGTTWRNSCTTATSSNRKGHPCYGKSLTTKVAPRAISSDVNTTSAPLSQPPPSTRPAAGIDIQGPDRLADVARDVTGGQPLPANRRELAMCRAE